MFSKILQLLQDFWRRMIGQNDLKTALRVDVAVSTEMSTALQQWSDMYKNQASWIKDEVKSLGLPIAIAGEIARSTTIEMKATVSGSARATWLQAQMDRVTPQLREKVEYGAAKGGIVFKPFVSNGQIEVDYVQADAFVPIAFDSGGRMTAVVFADTRQIGKDYYTRLEYHRLEGTTYTVQNLAYRSSTRDQLGMETSLAAVPAWAELQPITTIANVTKPLYGYFRYPLANHIDPASPLGVSCYSRAVGQIEQADRLYSNLCWEFKSGERAIYVDPTGLDKNTTTGKAILPSGEARLYRQVGSGAPIGEGELFKDWSPAFREVSILNGLDALLKKIEFLCGLAYGTLSDPQSVEKTATEIASSKQRSAATVVDTQKALKLALDGLLYAMDVYATITPSLGMSVPRGAFELNVDFDDSLVVDRAAQRLEDRQDVTLGVMAKWRYLMDTRGLTEAEAKKWIAEAQAEQPEPAFPAGA